MPTHRLNRRPTGGRSRRVVALVTVLLLLGAGQACGGPEPDQPAPDTGPTAAGPTDVLTRRGVCTDERSRCVPLGSGAVAVVYPALRDPGRATIVWEPGGPGLAPPTPGEARTILPAWSQRFDVAVVVERWVVDAPSEQCLTTLAGRPTSAGGSPPDGCDPAATQYTPTEYADLARTLDARVGRVAGLYATSFGVVRAGVERAAIGHSTWLVVDAPAPVPGTDAERLFSARARAVEQAVVELPRCAGDSCRDRPTALTRFLGGADGPEGPSRLDRAYAVLGLAYAPEDSVGWLRRFWASGGDPRGEDLATVEDAALTYTRRAAVDQALPERAGYVFGMCAAYQGWAVPGATADPLVAALDVLHEPCRSAPRPSWTAPARSSEPTLLLLNNDDLVTPVALQRGWEERLSSRTTVLTYAARGHGAAPDRLQRTTREWIADHSAGDR